LLGRRGFFQRESDLKVFVVNKQSDRSLPCLASHAVQKFPQHLHFLLKQVGTCVAVDDNRLIKQELAPLGVVTPFPLPFGKAVAPPNSVPSVLNASSTQNR